MMDSKNDGARGEHVGARRGIRLAVVVVLAIVLGAAAYLAYDAIQGDDSPDVGEGSPGVTILQNPSLRLVSQDGTWNVENDGNLTMSDVEVRDTAGAVICEIGTMSPGDLEPCEDAGDRQDLVVAGQGPQGQKVEEPAPAG